MTQHERQTLGARLRAAREAAGYTQEAAAEVLGVSRPTLSLIEAGRARLDSLSLRQLATLYRRPIDWFFTHEAAPLTRAGDAADLASGRIETLVMTHFAETAPADRATITQFLRFCRNLADLRERLGRKMKEPPEARPLGPRARKFAAEGAAIKERARLGLRDTPVGERVFDLLEERGVPTYRAPLADDRVSGLLVQHPAAGPVIFVNARQYRWRQVFTVAHEYGHLLLHGPTQPVACRIFTAGGTASGDAAGEALVNAFTSEFLMPEDGVKRFLVEAGATSDKLTEEQVVRLQRHFGVSFRAMIYRLQRLRLLAEAEARRMSEETRPVAIAWRLGYPLEKDEFGEADDPTANADELTIIRRFPHEYVALVLQAFEGGLISNGRAAELLELNRGSFDRFYREMRRLAERETQEKGLEHVVA